MFAGYVYAENVPSPSIYVFAPQITIDATRRGQGPFWITSLNGLGGLDRSYPHDLLMMPTYVGYAYQDDTLTVSFPINEDGTLDYDAAFDQVVTGRGTAGRAPLRRAPASPGQLATRPGPREPSAGSATSTVMGGSW
jgi:hypothetical protein